MIFSACEACPHGSVRNGISHCGRAALHSHLTRCIRDKALAHYIEAEMRLKKAPAAERQ